ncbi:MarR family transcriptional regulator [Pseudokineococcus lusitanus]|uniref:MarR family transcriptional regulator n=1 Tax=Pseudokineococcus lusitanus TaxID=763993 RepID=A0A3N1HK87_9ACTN|nr:MarR family transcriptional regulator [Pseudokineococcus lusitanus]
MSLGEVMTYAHDVPPAPASTRPAPSPQDATPSSDTPAATTARAPRARGTGAPTLAADLRGALMLSVRRIRAERPDDALPDHQYSVLALLDRLGPSTPGALADAEHVQPPTMTRTIAALVESGVVAKEPHPQDGRQVLVRTTDDGKALLQATRRRRDEWLTRRLAGLDAHERAVLAEAATILRRVVAP